MTDRRGQTWVEYSGALILVTASESDLPYIPRASESVRWPRRRVKHSVLILDSPLTSLSGHSSWVHETDELPWERDRGMRRLA